MNQKLKAPAGRRTLSVPVLVSVYVVCAAIIGLCIWQAATVQKNQILYVCLAVAALGYGIFISVMNAKNKNATQKR